MRHGGDGCGCGSGILCECGDGSVAGGGIGAPLHAHYVRGCAWACDDGFERDATGNACIVPSPPSPSPPPAAPPCTYTLMNNALPWAGADADCQAAGLQLATVQSAAQNEQLVTAAAGNKVWIGGTDAASEGTWVWSPSSTPLSYTNWEFGQPDDFFFGEDCL